MITVYLFAGSLVDLDHIIRASPSLSDIAMFNRVNDFVLVIEGISFPLFSFNHTYIQFYYFSCGGIGIF